MGMTTHRSPDREFASPGAVRAQGDSLPVYICDNDGSRVVWATSKRTGRKYLAGVSRGYMDQPYYVGSNIHDCSRIRAQRDERDWYEDHNRDVQYQLWLITVHRDGEHAAKIDRCLMCERGIDTDTPEGRAASREAAGQLVDAAL